METGAKVSDVLRSGVTVQVDLLTHFPDSADPTTWTKPTYFSYRTANCIPIPDVSVSTSLGGRIEATFDAVTVQYPLVVAFGVTHMGKCLFFGHMSHYRVNVDNPNKVIIRWFCEPWEGQ
jgi:hypothetical protein